MSRGCGMVPAERSMPAGASWAATGWEGGGWGRGSADGEGGWAWRAADACWLTLARLAGGSWCASGGCLRGSGCCPCSCPAGWGPSTCYCCSASWAGPADTTPLRGSLDAGCLGRVTAPAAAALLSICHNRGFGGPEPAQSRTPKLPGCRCGRKGGGAGCGLLPLPGAAPPHTLGLPAPAPGKTLPLQLAGGVPRLQPGASLLQGVGPAPACSC